jgi:hypothetical protein
MARPGKAPDTSGQGVRVNIIEAGVNPIRSILLVVVMAAASPVVAETMSFEAATAMLGASCGKDIETNCRGVNLDSIRLKECLSRNQDNVSPQCKADSFRALDAIQKRVAARAAVSKACERDALKFCAGMPKEDRRIAGCLVATARGLSAKCNQAIGEAGYRQ